MVVSSCWKQPVVQNMNSISLLWPSWLKEWGLECGDALKQRLEEEIWESYLCEEKCMLGHEVSMASWLCWFYQVWYCTVQSTWYSDCDYANIEDISFHEGAVQVQNGVIFYSYAAFNNNRRLKGRLLFYGTIVLYHWAAIQKKMLRVIASLGWNGKYDTAGNYIQKGMNGSEHGVLVQLQGSKAQCNGQFNSEMLG